MATLLEADANLAALQQRPRRMSITDLKTVETVEAQFNPSEFEETLRVNWARLHPPGLSHERLQYDHTENHKVTFELIFDAMQADGISGVDRNLDARAFLLSLCYAKRGARTVNDGEATRVLFMWPGFISLTAVIAELKFKHSRFNLAGQPSFFKVAVSLEEIRDTRLTSEEVRQVGTNRGPGGSLLTGGEGASDITGGDPVG